MTTYRIAKSGQAYTADDHVLKIDFDRAMLAPKLEVDHNTKGVRVDEDEPIIPEMQAWRLWYTKTSDAEPRLYSPISRPDRILVTDSRINRATCKHGCKEPPGRSCGCGFYAVENLVDGLWRLNAMVDSIQNLRDGWFPWFPTPDMVAVLARVNMRRVIRCNDGWRSPGWELPVVRAAEAEIDEVFVADDVTPADRVESLARGLAIKFGVWGSTGAPRYTQRDWDERPEWLRGNAVSRYMGGVNEVWAQFPRYSIE